MAPEHHLLNRSRPSIAIDLKHPGGTATVLRLVERADALIEGLRPGVTERLGLGPEDCAARNPGLVYGRVTGWGQEGPLARAAGHDLNYIALTGALDAIGRRGGPPTPPLNLVGDYGGGALYLALGVVAALLEARGSDFENRMCLILVGLTELRRRLSMACHESLSQRLVVRHHLTGLARDELDAYLTHRLRLAGCELPLFEPPAVEALFQGARGLPRQINRIAHYALSAAALDNARTVNADHLQHALEELRP